MIYSTDCEEWKHIESIAFPPRRCEREECNRPLPPDWNAVYCSNRCAWLDADLGALEDITDGE